MPTKKNLQACRSIGFKGGFVLHQVTGRAMCLAAAGTVRVLELAAAVLGKR